jgi:hypothetical protein
MKAFSVTLFVLFLAATLPAAGKDWSAWTKAGNDDAIEFHFKVVPSPGSFPACLYELRNTFANVVEVVFWISFEGKDGPVKQKRTVYLGQPSQVGQDDVFFCKDIKSIDVIRTDRRARTQQPR